MRSELAVAGIVLVLVGSCAPAPSAIATAVVTPAASASDERCALLQVAIRIPAAIRKAITAARQGDAAGSEAAMKLAQTAASELHRQVDATGRLAVTTRARFASAESFAQQADEVFLGTAPGVPNAETLVELERGVTQLESLLSAVGAPCSS